MALDGVYLRDDDGSPTFYALPEPTTEDVTRVAGWVRDKFQELIGGRGMDIPDEPQLDLLAEEEPLSAECSAASITGTVASGRRAGRSVVRVQEALLAGWRGDSPSERCANVEGFSIHANVCVRTGDRKRLEKIARYVTRPPLATERLEELPDGGVQYVLRRPWSDGTISVGVYACIGLHPTRDGRNASGRAIVALVGRPSLCALARCGQRAPSVAPLGRPPPPGIGAEKVRPGTTPARIAE